MALVLADADALKGLPVREDRHAQIDASQGGYSTMRVACWRLSVYAWLKLSRRATVPPRPRSALRIPRRSVGHRRDASRGCRGRCATPAAGAKQTAYQILVASTPEKLAADEGDLWDSGRVASDQSTQVVYAGKPLLSRTRCHWKVRLWDAEGNPTAYSKPAVWSMGLLKPERHQGEVDRHATVRCIPAPPPKRRSPTFDGCVWVWAAEKGVNAREKAPAGTRYFRKSLTIPQGNGPFTGHSSSSPSTIRWNCSSTGRRVGGGRRSVPRNWSTSRKHLQRRR